MPEQREATPMECLGIILEVADTVSLPGQGHRNLAAAAASLKKLIEEKEEPKEE